MVGDVNLDDVDKVLFQEWSQLGRVVDSLTQSNRVGGSGSYLAQTSEVKRQSGLLEPAGFNLRGVRHHPCRRRTGEAPMHFDKDLDICAYGIPDRNEDVLRGAVLCATERACRSAKRIDFEPPISSFHDFVGHLPYELGVSVALVPAVGVCRHFVAECSTKKFPDGLSESLTHHVPAGDIEGSQGRLADLAGETILGHLNVPGQPRNIEGVHPNDVALPQLIDCCQERVRLVHHPHFTKAGDSLISLNLNDSEFAPRRSDHNRAEARDFHWCPFGVGCVMFGLMDQVSSLEVVPLAR